MLARHITLLLFVFGFFTSSAGAADPELNLSQAVIIDVRTQAEWQSAHLADAILIPWEGIVAGVAELNLDKDKPIALFCRSGNRAAKAMALLNAEGYTQLVNLGSLEQAAKSLEQVIVNP